MFIELTQQSQTTVRNRPMKSTISNQHSTISRVYEGRVFSVEVGRRRFPDGRDHEVAIVRHRPSVVLIPVEDDGRIVLVRQYRPALDRELWEFPAGSLDAGESADAAARRECEEEIGRAPDRIERLGGWFPT